MIQRTYRYLIPNFIILVNCIMIIFIAYIITQATTDIVRNDQARNFLEMYRYLPLATNRMWLILILLIVFITVSFMLKMRFRLLAIPLCLADLAAAIVITMCLNYCYTGLFLFVILCAVIFINNISLKILVCVAAVVGYIYYARGLNMLSAYIAFMVDMDVDYLQRTINLISTINQMLFLLFIVLMIREEMMANKIALSKNELLSKTTEHLELLNYELTENAEKSQEIARLKERTRLASEIHDSAGHYITSMIMGIDACIELFDKNRYETKKLLTQLAQLSRESMLDIRASVYELKLHSIESFSMEQLTKSLIDNISPYTDIKFHLGIRTGDKLISTKDKKLCMRIVQESMTNCIKHSSAKNMYIEAEVAGSELCMEIRDDGVGCAQLEEGFGLKTMRERIKEVDGNIEIITGLNNGLTIQCRFTLEK